MVLAGGSGFIGGEVRRLLTRLQYEVVVVGRPKEKRGVALPSILVEPTPPPDRTWADIEVTLAGCDPMKPFYQPLYYQSSHSHKVVCRRTGCRPGRWR